MLTGKEILEACQVIHLLSVHEFIQQTLSTHFLPGIVIGVEIQMLKGPSLPPGAHIPIEEADMSTNNYSTI